MDVVGNFLVCERLPICNLNLLLLLLLHRSLSNLIWKLRILCLEQQFLNTIVTHGAVTLQSEQLERFFFRDELTFDSESLLGNLLTLNVLISFVTVSFLFLFEVALHFQKAFLSQNWTYHVHVIVVRVIF